MLLVENDEDIDLNFVVHGDFFEENLEFNPITVTDGQEKGAEPEEINNDFGDDNENFAIPMDKDDDLGSGR